tara:strand:- start:1079 stop:1813 length:735 start_codon:yes stop_codon:yes gene_type:complete
VKLHEELSILIPCKNDEEILLEKIQTVIDFCELNIKDYEILIVLNGSTKQNKKLMNSFISNNPNENINVIESDKIGKGAAVKEGLNNALYETVLISDADFSVSIDHFTKFLDNEGNLLSDFVVGSRKLYESQNLETPLSRIITGLGYTFFVKILLGINISDTQCGFKAINKKNFTNHNTFLMDGFSYDVELFLLAKKNKISTTEVPVQYIHNDDSNINIVWDPLKMAIEMVIIFFRYRVKGSIS